MKTLVDLYQPIICLRTRSTIGFEALARWPGTREDRAAGLLDRGLAHEMLTRAAVGLAAWRQVDDPSDLFVHVNITSEDLKRPGLADTIADLLLAHRLPAGSIIVEITEQMPIREMAHAVAVLLAVKEAGAGVVIDDFGSGYSSLSWLHDLPADGLKVDADLTRKLGSERGNVILAATAQLGHALGMSVTAEGVEDTGQARQLRALGFDRVQGYGFGKPMPAGDIPAFLETGAPAKALLGDGGQARGGSR
ncbi:MAG: EAL domain-containing protein [Pseudomonadota bacterium]